MNNTDDRLLGAPRPSGETDSGTLNEADLSTFGRSNGFGLKRKDPKTYAAIVRALKAGCSLRETARIFAVSKNTVHAICYRELGADGVKQAIIRNLRQLVHQTSEELLEETGSLSPQSKAVVLGICADKLAAMADPVQEIPLAPQVVQIFPNITNEFAERLIQAAQTKKPHIDV